MIWTTRKGIPGDEAALAGIIASSWKAAYTGLLPESVIEARNEARRVEQFREDLPRKEREYRLTLADGAPCGLSILAPAGLPDTGELQAFYARPEFWGSGAAAVMMGDALARLREMGFSQVLLWVLRDNQRARRFYEKAGFFPDGTEKSIYTPDILELRLRRLL